MTPKLRFPEFIDDWKTITFGELVEDGVILKPMDGNHGEIHPTSKDYVEDGVPFLMASDISNGQINFNDCKKISESTAKGLRKGFAQNNDVLLTHKGTVGETAVLETDLDFVMLTPQVTYYRVNDKSMLDSYFLHSAFQASRFQKYLNIISGGGTRAYIGITKQLLLKMSTPTVSEQKRIASIFIQLDQKINLLTKKKEALETYKKGLMQKLFSQELRFKREDGSDYPEWDYQPLGDLAYITSGKSNREDSDTEATYHFFDRSSDVRRSGIYLFDDDAVIVAGEGQEFIPKKFSGKFDLHQRAYAIMKFGDRLSYEYCYYFIFHHRRYFERMAVGTTVLSLRLPMFQKMMIQLPSMEEQDKIVAVFTNLDVYLKNVSYSIQSTELLKKGLLQQMFV